MKVHVMQPNGDSIVLGTRIVYVGNYCSAAERSTDIQFWSNPIQNALVSFSEVD